MSSESAKETLSPGLILHHVDGLLRNSLFKGTFKERKYVPALNACRDVIVIHKSEEELIKKVREAIRYLEYLDRFKSLFVGISESEPEEGCESEFLLWTSTAHENAFGDYLFCVPGLISSADEISVTLLYIRKLEAADFEAPCIPMDRPISEVFCQKAEILSNLCVDFVTECFTFQNLKSAAQFISALLLTVFVSFGNFSFYFGEFLIKFLRELSFFMEAATPILFGCLHVLNNAIYGLYSLILCLFKSNTASIRAPPPPDHMAAIKCRNNRTQAMQYQF